MEKVYLMMESDSMFKCILFRYDMLPTEDYRVDLEPQRSFDDILDEEPAPFHDEISVKFLSETFGIEFADGMHYSEGGMQYYLHSFAKSVKECLMLLRNSKRGVYTLISEMQSNVAEYIHNFEDFDLLFVLDVMQDRPSRSPVAFLYPMEVGNFVFRGSKTQVLVGLSVPDDAQLVYQTGEWFHLYGKNGRLYSDGNFFTLYDYDFKRDLPSVQEYIGRKYKNYKFFGSYERICTCKDLFGSDTDCSGLGNIKVINHMGYISKLEADSRRAVCLKFLYMNDGSVVLRTGISVKYPSAVEIIGENLPVNGNIRFKFILFVDTDEVMYKTQDLDYTWFGAYFYRDCIELYDKDGALLELAKQIPDVLKKMGIPVSKDHDG